nr:PREDICTED: thymus-specific serine protease [Lepisosteus oculatus]
MALSAWLLLPLLHLAGSGRVFDEIKQRVLERQEQAIKEHLLLQAASGRPLVTEGRLEQPLDHFDRQNNRTYLQRYFVNEQFWKRRTGPVFLYIGGEAAISEFSVQGGHHVSMAQDHGALLVSLEHRFYGQSIPADGMETPTLRYLSSQQALADLVSFQQNITSRYELTPRNTWICFGGSYPGSLSAWLRGKFPHLVYGAVASSAPVRAQLDFTGYNKVVAKSLANPAVGGSDRCLSAVREGFSAVESALASRNVTAVSRDFSCCSAVSEPEDQRELLYSLADIAMGAVQYDQEGAPLGVAQLCRIMAGNSSGADSYTRLAQLAKAYLERTAKPCLETSHQQSVAELRDTTLRPSGVGERQWYYQTCTEFGYYQTCEDDGCPFSRLLTLKSQTELCPLVFGLKESSLPLAVGFTNDYYGSDHPGTHRVLYVNGDIDPWHVLSVLSNATSGERAILIHGTAHCADMNPPRPSDPPALMLARKEIEAHVAAWLQSAAQEAA